MGSVRSGIWADTILETESQDILAWAALTLTALIKKSTSLQKCKTKLSEYFLFYLIA